MASRERILDVNRRYHDVAAAEYDSKWGVDFGWHAGAQVLGKMSKLLGEQRQGQYDRSLEIGSGTGYFSLNLRLAEVVKHATCTDVSPGMLEQLDLNAKRNRIANVETKVAEAGELPFEDESFDLVMGHAVLHHLPDLDAAWSEFARVLRPGGTVFFAGEPSYQGDRIANVPKQAAVKLSPLWRTLMRARPAEPFHGHGNGAGPDQAAVDHALEWEVDQHAFTPDALKAPATTAGLQDVRVRGEELLANWFGWFNRTLESSARHEDLPMPWIQYAYRGYLGLQKVDRALLEPRLPPAIFYNLMIAATKPA
jgi:ubiquinone/menaquinone biosynthesis C-methylase UbiE